MAILGNFIRIDVSTDSGVTFRYLGRETGNQLEEQADTLRYVGREFKYPVFKKTTRTAQASVRGLIDYSSEVNYAQIQNWYAQDIVLVFRIYAVGKPETIFNGQIVSFAKISDVGSSASYSFAIAIDGKPTVISLQQPTGLAATTGTLPGQVNLSWTNNASGATGYEIWAKKAIETAFVQIATTTNLTSYTAELLDSDTSYNFQVRATAEAGASLFSNTATASTLTPAHVATAGFSGNVSPTVTKSGDTAIWRIGNVIITSNAPTFVVIPGTLVELHGTASQFTEINLNPLLVRSDLEIVGLTSLLDYSATAGNLDSVIFDSLVRRANLSIDLTNSVVPGATNVKIYNLIRSLLEANGGTYSDNGSNFTGTAGQNHSGRTLALGTVVLDPTTDQITLDMITTLQAVGWTITTILTLCNKFLDFYLVKNTIIAGGQTARYEIPKNYTTNRPANSPILISVDDSEIVPGTLSLKLFDTDGTTELASNFAAINTDLQANDRTGGFIEVSGLPTGDDASLTVTINDFPTSNKVCGEPTLAGTYLKLDGANDYTQSDASTPFTQWERTQPFTFFCKFKHSTNYNVKDTIFATNPTGSDAGIVIDVFNNSIAIDLFSFLNNPTTRTLKRLLIPTSLRVEDVTLQITYNGNSNTSGMKFYWNNAELTLPTLTINGLSQSIINLANQFTVGRNNNRDDADTGGVPGRYFKGTIFNMSFVDYVKSSAERTTDFNNQYQKAGAGTYLFNYIPLYPTIIKSLDPTQKFKEVSDNLDVNIFGKNNPMNLTNDFDTDN